MKQELCHLIVKTSKEDSVFLYFALESCDGLAFYSTLPHQRGDDVRRVDLKSPLGLQTEFRQLLSSIRARVPSLEIELDEIVQDERSLENIFTQVSEPE